MSGRFVRASKYRHVFGEPAKPDKCFSGLAPAASFESAGIAVSQSLAAYLTTGGGGPVGLLKRASPGRINKYHAVCNVHKSAVLDMDFSPFLDRMLGTASDDGTAAITVLPEPEDLKEVTEPNARLEGHQKKVHLLKFHPTANNVVATGSYDNHVKVWDMEQQIAKLDWEGKEYPLCLDWNSNGSMLAATTKDKMVRIYDPRQSAAAVEVPTFPGSKGSRVVWMENVNSIGTFGFSAQGTRQLAILDTRNLSAKGSIIDIDQGSSMMILLYDSDNSILYGAGKGDAKVMYWEAVSDAPYMHYLTEFRDSESTKGLAWLPKRYCNTTTCEIACAYRLTSKSVLVPISFQVPRKSDMFQEDIYPDAYAGIPTQTSDAYFSGGNAEPSKTSMRPGSNSAAGPAVSFNAAKSPAVQLAEANAEIAKLNAEVARLKAKLAQHNIAV